MPLTSATSPPSSVAQTLHHCIEHAVALGASDIHFESDASEFRIRLRIDGHLHILSQQSTQMRDALLSRLKVLARLDIAEKRLPQDGRIQYPLAPGFVDLRVSSMPTVHGEKLVVRVLDHTRAIPSLASLGYEADDEKTLLHALHQPHGMILMTGPTGSGKTLSLYSCLGLLNRSEVNISTIEDPCEIQLSGINQMHLNERAGLTFATALRAMLRQDPDVLMVGEIRDSETAEIAIQAAQTGHLVLSTLHTNNAPATLMRLRHMGVSSFSVAASVLLVVAQRLVRRLCPHCKKAVSSAQQAQLLSSLSTQDMRVIPSVLLQQPVLYEAMGCELCLQGYKGRIGIYQMMPIDDNLQHLMLEEVSLQQLAQYNQQAGQRTLRQAGYVKVLQGVTSWQEIMAHTA